MVPIPRGTRWFARQTLLAFGAVLALAASASAKDPEPPQSGFAPNLPALPSKSGDTKSFLDGVTTNEAMFEVVVGQGRVLTLKENIAGGEGKQQPTLAVGDPNVASFQVIGLRQIRVTGL